MDVITTLPNRYRTLSQAAPQAEGSEGSQITGVVVLPAHHSDMLGHARTFLSYARQVLRIVATRLYDLVFATSCRLMRAALGAWIARVQKVPLHLEVLYLDVRDIFVDTIGEILPRPLAIPLRLVFAGIESWTMRRAKRINLVSPGEKVLPSKIFEYAALGKPILAGVRGYAARFLAQEISNSAVFAPGDVEQAVRALQALEIVTRPRPEFVKTYARTNIARAMAQDVLATVPRGSHAPGIVTGFAKS